MAKDRVYEGDRTINGIVVTVDNEPLDPRYDIASYTDLGFEWTFVGDNSRQLALAILMDHLNDADRARALTEAFTERVVANFSNEWMMRSDDVAAVIAQIEATS